MYPSHQLSGLLRPLVGRVSFLCLLVFFAASASAALFTDHTYDQAGMSVALKAAGIPANRLPSWSAQSFAEVKRSELPTFEALFLRRLSQRGLGVSSTRSGWDRRFNCWAFSQAFVVDANLTLALELFHSWSPAERAAIIPFAFQKGDGTSHAITLILTDAGPTWWDPQTGEHRALTPAELNTIWYPQS